MCVRVTRRCNAFCSFCQAPNTSRKELSVNDLGAISAVLRDRGVRSLKLSGGEPTVRVDLPEIVTTVGAVLDKVVVISNGIDVRAEVLDAIARVGGEVQVQRAPAGRVQRRGVPGSLVRAGSGWHDRVSGARHPVLDPHCDHHRHGVGAAVHGGFRGRARRS
ncbi:radical SAM protein [Actinokineospora inagensis]|uniref:radical SAM protein n=1 Tax=Actinokineospora inagensis TaxID=103730 RepID=UPI000A006741